MRTILSLLCAAVLVACSSDGTGSSEAKVTATGVWSAASVPGTQIFEPRMQLTEGASGAITGTVTYTAGTGGGAGPLPDGGTVQGTRQGSAVTLTWNTSEPHTFTGTLNGDFLTGTLTYNQIAPQVTFQR